MSIFYRAYSSTADAVGTGTSTTYATARNTAAGTGSATATVFNVGQSFLTPNYAVTQGFYQFDTSTFPASGTGSFSLNATVAASNPGAIIEVSETAAITNKIAGGSLGSLTQLGSWATVNTTGRVVAALSAVSVSATLRLVCYAQNERLNVAPTSAENQSYNAADFSGTANDPYVQVLAGASWVYVGRGTSVEATATSHVLTEPAGVAAGDLLVACIGSRIASTTSITLPSGWTLVAEAKNNNTLSTSSALPSGMMAYIVRGSSAPSYTFTHPVAPNVALGRVVAYRNVHQTTPTDSGTTAVTTATALLAVSVTGLTTTADDDLIVALTAGGQEAAWSAFAATDPATGSGTTADSALDPIFGAWLERSDIQTTTGNDTSLAVFDAIKQTAGATGNLIATASVSAGHVVVAGSFKLASSVTTSTGTLTVTLDAMTAAGAGSVTTPARTGYLGTPWTPAALGSDLLTWLDAGDASTVTVSGSGVSEWRDKSGNARHASQFIDSSRPPWSGTKVALDGATYLLLAAGLPTTYDCIIVGRPRDNAYAGASGYRVALQVDSGNYPVLIDNAGTIGTYGGGFSGSGYSWGSVDGFDYATINGTTSVATHGMNGGAQQFTGSGVAASAPISLNRSDYPMPFGDVYEIAFVTYGASLDTKQKLEGYVAHKWGLSGLLPGGHPFKTAPSSGGYELGALTLAATGGDGTLRGTFNQTLGQLTALGTGRVTVKGTAAITLGALTALGTGAVLVRGTLSTTLGALTAAATGDVEVHGTLAATLGALTAAGTGSVASATDNGTLVATFAPLTLVGTGGAPADTGTLSATLGALTLAAAGDVEVHGTLVVTLDALTLAGTGAVGSAVDNGTLAVTFAPLTLAGTGGAGVDNGTLSTTLAPLTLAGTGGAGIDAGTLNTTLAPLTLVALGKVAVQGTATITLGAVTAAGTGTVVSTPRTATLAVTLDPVTLLGFSGAVPNMGTAAITLEPATLAGVGNLGPVPIAGTLSATLDALALSALGTVVNQVFSGTLSATLAPLTVSGTGKVLVGGTAAVTLSPLTVVATGTVANQVFSGTLSATLGALTAAATGTVLVRGTATATLAPMLLAGAGTVANQVFSGTLNTTLSDLTLAAIGKVAVKGSLATTLDPVTLAGTGTVAVRGTLGATLDPATLDAAGTVANQVFSGTANITLGNLTLAGSGAITTTARTGQLAVTLGDLVLLATGDAPRGWSPELPGLGGWYVDDPLVALYRMTESGGVRLTEQGIPRVIEGERTPALWQGDPGAANTWTLEELEEAA